MAKKSKIARNEQRKEKSNRYYKYREELKAKIINEKLSDDERYEAQVKFQKLPRNTSIHRVVNRCYLTGRTRGHLKKFGLSRIAVRELANLGQLPGVTKSSW